MDAAVPRTRAPPSHANAVVRECRLAFAVIIVASSVGVDAQSELVRFSPVEIAVGPSRAFTALVPHGRGLPLSNPEELLVHVLPAWNVVVVPNQHGLVDAKAVDLIAAELTEDEAVHHFYANRAGHVDSARLLIPFGLVPALQSGGAPLHVAAGMGNLRAIDDLLAGGADVDAPAADGSTPLLIASTGGNVQTVRRLLAHGAALETGAAHGATALQAAAAMGHEGVVQALLAAGADCTRAHPFAGTTALHFAAELDHAAVVTRLCAHTPGAVQKRTRTGATPLHTAADSNAISAVRALLREPCAADPNALLAGDTAPLYLAAQRGLVQAITELCAGGADADLTLRPPADYTGAVVAPSGDAAARQLAYYPERNTEYANGATALHAAAENGHAAAVRALLRAPCHASQLPSMRGWTPLITAIEYGHVDVALALLEQGADRARVHVRLSNGATALHLAHRRRMHEVEAAIRSTASSSSNDPDHRRRLSVDD